MAVNKGSFTTTNYEGRGLLFSWEIKEQDIANNKTTISWSLKGTGTGAVRWYMAGNFKVVIAGETVYNSSNRITLEDGTTVATGEKIITHNTDGTKSFSASAEAGIYTVAVNCSGSGSWELTPIPRAATITSAPNFNDEGNPTINYSNLAGNNATTLQACIANESGGTIYAAYRNISKTGTSYTFNLTDAERKALRKAVTKGNTVKVRFFISTVIAGETYTNYSEAKTLSLINYYPTLSPTIVDVGATSTKLTGGTTTVIKGFNSMKITFNAAAVKEATIASVKVTNGLQSRTSDGTLQNCESGLFTFVVTDSRGNNFKKEINRTLVEYFKPTISQNITAALDGETTTKITIKLSGTFFNGSFGAANNAITLEMRHTDDSGAWVDWFNVSAMKAPTISGNNYTLEITNDGWSYDKAYKFQARITDSTGNTNSRTSTPEETVQLKPLFDYGKEDFNFNVPEIKMSDITILRKADTTNSLILATEAASNGGIYLRPQGTNTDVGQIRITYDGKLYLTAGVCDDKGNILLRKTDNNNVIVSCPTNASAGIYLRPNGSSSEVGQVRILQDGTVQINGNSVADFVTQTGTSGIWTYEKWASGKAVCWGILTDNGAGGTTAIDGSNTSYRKRSADFPSGLFITTPIVMTTANDVGSGVATAENDNSTKDTCNTVMWGAAGAFGGISVYAIGRWKN